LAIIFLPANYRNFYPQLYIQRTDSASMGSAQIIGGFSGARPSRLPRSASRRRNLPSKTHHLLGEAASLSLMIWVGLGRAVHCPPSGLWKPSCTVGHGGQGACQRAEALMNFLGKKT
jgi:hypothetical protein